jgi:lipopolysaccharide biosynthesis glycosyltransferase
MYHVVYVTDANYWMHLYISLYSLIKNNKEKYITVYILTDQVNQDFIDNLHFIYKTGNLWDCKIIKVNSSVTDIFPINSFFHHVTKATYYRIFIGQLLPKDVSKVLYLDCDTVIESSLEELFEIDLKDHVLAAVPDILSSDDEINRLDLPQGSKYYNAGILLINLEKWRKINFEISLLTYIEQNSGNPDKIRMNDQDVLNAMLGDKCLELNAGYNYQEYGESIRHKDLSALDVKIIHYFCYPKPWHYLSEHPLKARYWYYLNETPYKGYREEDRNVRNILFTLNKKIINRLKKILNQYKVCLNRYSHKHLKYKEH